MGRTAFTKPQCLYNGALYLYFFFFNLKVVKKLPQNVVADVCTPCLHKRHISRGHYDFTLQIAVYQCKSLINVVSKELSSKYC
jgi:hypothetical protein